MRTVWLVALAMTASACDWLMTVDATVEVPPEVQQTVSAWPQQVLLRHGMLEDDVGPPAAYRIAVLCEPSAERTVVTWYYSRVNGCGERSTITAWLEPLDPAAGLPCGATDRRGVQIAADRVPPAGAASATVPVFDGGSCPKNEVVTLTVAAPVQ